MLLMTPTDRGVKAAWQELERQSVTSPKPWVSPADGLIDGRVDMPAVVRKIVEAVVSKMSDRPVKDLIKRLREADLSLSTADLARAAVYLENVLAENERLKQELKDRT